MFSRPALVWRCIGADDAGAADAAGCGALLILVGEVAVERLRCGLVPAGMELLWRRSG